MQNNLQLLHANNHIHTKVYSTPLQSELKIDGSKGKYTVNAPFINLTVYGKSEQNVTVQGKNLLDLTGIDRTQQGVTCFLQSDGTVRVDGTTVGKWWNSASLYLENRLTRGETYTFSMQSTVPQLNLIVRTLSVDGTVTYSRTVVFDNTVDTVTVYLQINDDGIGTNAAVRIQMEKGTVATTWEPFVPNSPSPDYPSPINSSENFDVVSCGRNLIDEKSKILNKACYAKIGNEWSSKRTTYTHVYYFSTNSGHGGGEFANQEDRLKLKAGTYTFSFDWRAVDGSDKKVKMSVYASFLSDSMTVSKPFVQVDTSHSDIVVRKSITFTLTETAVVDFLIQPCVASSAADNFIYFKNVQLEDGSTPTPYLPYSSTTAHITDPLRSVGDVSDSIEVSDGKVEVVRRCEVKVFDGSERFTQNVPNSLKTFYSPLPNLLTFPGKYSDGFCTHYMNVLNATRVGISFGGYGSVLFLTSDKDTSAEKIKAYFTAQYTARTPVTILYQIATPTRTDITTTPLGQQLLSMHTVQGYTRIFTNQTIDSANSKILPMINAGVKILGQGG